MKWMRKVKTIWTKNKMGKRQNVYESNEMNICFSKLFKTCLLLLCTLPNKKILLLLKRVNMLGCTMGYESLAVYATKYTHLSRLKRKGYLSQQQRACTSAQSHQSLLSYYVEQKEALNKEPEIWPYWIDAHARLKEDKLHDIKVLFLMSRLLQESLSAFVGRFQLQSHQSFYQYIWSLQFQSNFCTKSAWFVAVCPVIKHRGTCACVLIIILSVGTPRPIPWISLILTGRDSSDCCLVSDNQDSIVCSKLYIFLQFVCTQTGLNMLLLHQFHLAQNFT